MNHGGHAEHGEDHGHASPHGGVVKSAGDYHLELVTGNEGALTLHVLGADEKVAHPIAATFLAAQAQPREGGAFTAVRFEASPLAGEPAGQSSRFGATLPESLHGRALALTVNVSIAGKPYRAEFELGAAGGTQEHEDHDR